MREAYEALEMEVIAFDGEIWTARDDGVIEVSGDPTNSPYGN